MNLKSEEIVEHHNVSSFAAAHVKRELKRLAKIEDPPKEKQYYGIDINKYCQRKDLKEGVRMDNFTIIYKILKALEQAMDYDEFDVNKISHTRLNITYQRWEKILIMLSKSGYIEGVAYDQCGSDYCPHIEEPISPVITLKGLEYLSDNSLMKKAANILKGIKETVPGL